MQGADDCTLEEEDRVLPPPFSVKQAVLYDVGTRVANYWTLKRPTLLPYVIDLLFRLQEQARRQNLYEMVPA